MATEETLTVKIPRANLQTITLVLEGVGAGLLVQRFGETKLRELEGKTLGEAKNKKAPRNYEQEFQEARYIQDGKDVFPACSIKKTVVAGCRFVDGVFMTRARGAFFILGEYVEIHSDPPVMHKVPVKIGKGTTKTTQIRIRPKYCNWHMNVPIRYDANIISADQLVHLFVQAGFSVGMGEWTARSDGSFGAFEVKTLSGNGQQ